MSTESEFSFSSYRQLCRYLGEMDALVELTELAARHFVAEASLSGDPAPFIKKLSDKFGVVVNISEFDQFSKHLSRNYIVTVYQSAERFFHDFRKDHIALYRSQWSDKHDEDSLSNILRNLGSIGSSKMTLDNYLTTRFNYYRLIRNWTIHPKDESNLRENALKSLGLISECSTEACIEIGSKNKPNSPDSIDFQDFILFTRIVKTIAHRLCQMAKPSKEQWRCLVPTEQLKRFNCISNDPVRMRNAISGFIRTEYGIDAMTAYAIANDYSGPLA